MTEVPAEPKSNKESTRSRPINPNRKNRRYATATCRICKKTLDSKYNLWRHEKNVHSQHLCKCLVCSQLLANVDSFRRHLKFKHDIFDDDDIDQFYDLVNKSAQMAKPKVMQTPVVKNPKLETDIEFVATTVSDLKNYLKSVKNTQILLGGSFKKQKLLPLITAFNCYECNGSYSNMKDLFKHVKTHENDWVDDLGGSLEVVPDIKTHKDSVMDLRGSLEVIPNVKTHEDSVVDFESSLETVPDAITHEDTEMDLEGSLEVVSKVKTHNDSLLDLGSSLEVVPEVKTHDDSVIDLRGLQEVVPDLKNHKESVMDLESLLDVEPDVETHKEDSVKEWRLSVEVEPDVETKKDSVKDLELSLEVEPDAETHKDSGMDVESSVEPEVKTYENDSVIDFQSTLQVPNFEENEEEEDIFKDDIEEDVNLTNSDNDYKSF